MTQRETAARHPNRSGVAAVEMALVLPIFMMILWGVVEFGRAMMVGQLVTNAARHGARLAIIDGTTSAQVRTAVQNSLLSTVGGITAADVTVTVEVTPAPGNPNPANETAAAHTNDICQVAVSVPYRAVGYVSGHFLAAANLRAVCVMRHE